MTCAKRFNVLQVEVCADYDKKEVRIIHRGFHPSRVATKLLQKGDAYILGPMGWFELFQGNFRYHVYFGEEVIKSDLAMSKTGSKRVHNDDIVPPPRKKTVSSQKTLHFFVDEDPVTSTFDLSPTWKEVDSLLVFQCGPSVNSPKIASFDLDNTVVETSSGKRFATGPTDWKIMRGVTEKLKSHSKQGYKVVLLSNQLGISKGKPTKDDFKQKVEDIAARLQVPLVLMAATTKSKYRKPCTGMWDHLIKFENAAVEVDMKSSFYVGDAAGREDKWMPGTYVQL